MSALLSTIANTKIKVRWEEPYVSEALNKVAAIMPAGLQWGFTPVTTGGLSIELHPSSETGTSAILYRNTSSGMSSLYLETAPITLDLTAFDGSVVYIGVEINYSVGAATTGEIRAYSQAEYDAGLGDVVLVAVVDVASPSVDAEDIDTSLAGRAWKERLLDESAEPQNAMGAFVAPAHIWADGGAVSTGGVGTQIEWTTELGSVDPLVARMRGTGAANNKRIRLGVFATTENEQVFLRYRRRTVSCTATGMLVEFNWLDSTGTTLGATDTVGRTGLVADTSPWEYTIATGKAPAGAYFCLVTIVGNPSAGRMMFEDFFVADDSGRARAMPAAAVKAFLGASFWGSADPAATGHVRMAGSALSVVGAEADIDISAQSAGKSVSIAANANATLSGDLARLQGDTGATVTANGVVEITTTSGNVEISPGLGGQTEIAGGYASSGVTVTSAGDVQAAGDLTVDGNAEAGTVSVNGGYSSGAGVTLTGPGSGSFTGDITVDDNFTITNGARRTHKWLGRMLARGIQHDSTSFTVGNTYIRNTSSTSRSVYYALPDLPYGATIVRYGAFGQRATVGSSGSVTVSIKSVYYFVASSVTTEDSVTTPTNTLGAGDAWSCTQTSVSIVRNPTFGNGQIYIQVDLANGGTTNAHDLLYVYVDWVLSDFTPVAY